MSVSGPELRDIHLPMAGWWPPAPGWWGVAGLIAVVAGLSVWWWVGRRPARRLLREALREVDALEAAHVRERDPVTLAAGASRLLRRIARRIKPSLVALDDGRWRAFLRRYATDDQAAMVLECLVDLPFRSHAALDSATLLVALRGWCRNALRTGPHWWTRRRDVHGGRRSAAA